ncbi:MAG: hypothetical protein OXP12_04615 [Thaumarchaeota archaeon]|nr:hypothetical protein [Nitrososphaerota archaeon]
MRIVASGGRRGGGWGNSSSSSNNNRNSVSGIGGHNAEKYLRRQRAA